VNQPIVSTRTSPNGNPWWIVYHRAGPCYEAQVAVKTKRVLIGWGPKFIANKIVTCEQVLNNVELQDYIRKYLTQGVLDEVSDRCRELLS
jgi:hypothetical protein